VAPGFVYSSLNSRRRSALSPLGRFYAQRAFGLPMANRSQHRTRSLSFMISTTYPPVPAQASGTPIQPTAAATPGSQLEPRVWKISAEAVSPQRALTKRQRCLQKFSAGISLVILSLGFSFLGLLSFFNKPHADLANVPCVDSAYRIAGSAASLLAGTTFVVASCVYWRQYPGWPA
jgi:hypothetical protein